MANFDFSDFHPGHKLAVVQNSGSCLVVCLDCGVAGEIEGISAKITVGDTFKTAAEAGLEPRIAHGKLSVGRPAYKGGKK